MARPVVWPTNPTFFPYGNTPPVSLLRDVPPEVDPNILLLGCGDPRSILYSVYTSNLDDPLGTQKVDFTCCDHEPAILARNIILLALILRVDYKDRRPRIWNIFYNLYLDHSSLRLLIEQCKALAEVSKDFDTWDSSRYGRFIKIGTRFTLDELHKLWEWYAAAETWSESKQRGLKRTFRLAMHDHEKLLRGFVMVSPGRSAGPMWPNATLVANEAYHRYWETGRASAENDLAGATTRYLVDLENALPNPLFAYAHGQEGFFAYRGTCPVVPFLPAEYLTPLGGDAPPNPSTGDYNSIAKVQFFKWCDRFRSCVQRTNRIMLRMVIGDALAFCRTVQQYRDFGRKTAFCRVYPWRAPLLILDGPCYSSSPSRATAPLTFDVINTSTLWDHVGILNVLSATAPLLSHNPWATLYTEITMTYGTNSATDFVESLCAKIDTISVLFDLCPVPYMTGFTTRSSSQNLLMALLVSKSTGTDEHIPWKRPSSLAGPEGRDLRLKMSALSLTDWIFELHFKMFPHESHGPLYESLVSQQERSRLHYSRGSLALLLSHLASRIDVDWEGVLDELIRRMDNTLSPFTSCLSYTAACDFMCQLHLLGLFTHPSLYRLASGIPGSGLKLNGWSRFGLPLMVCVAITVPRAVFEVLDDKDSAHNPCISAALAGGGTSNHFISSVEAFHGTLTVEGSGENAKAYVNEDPLGWRGKSPIVVTFCVATNILTRACADHRVALSVIATPIHSELYSKFDMGRFHMVSLMDNSVEVFRHKPTVRGDPIASVLPAPSVSLATSTAASPVVVFDSNRERIASMKVHVPVSGTRMGRHLAGSKPEISYDVIGPCEIRISLEEEELQVVSFPHPMNWKNATTSLVREQGIIEVVATPATLGNDTRNIALSRFPVLAFNNSVFPWNIHRVWFNRLPRVSTKWPTHVQWIGKHTSFALSDNEAAATVQSAPLTKLRACISSIFNGFVGSPSTPSVKVTTIIGPNARVECLVLTTGIYLDLSAHTVVADAFVVPKYDGFLKPLEDASIQRTEIKFTAEQLAAWNHLLPALVERCRDWTHAGNCSRTMTRRPRLKLLAAAELPICGCGEGRVTDAFNAEPTWGPWAQHATRIAISPLFAVPYLEPTLQNITTDSFYELLQDDHGLSDVVLMKLTLTGGRVGQDHSQTVCSNCYQWVPRAHRKRCGACKDAIYCSVSCQREDWREHKFRCDSQV